MIIMMKSGVSIVSRKGITIDFTFLLASYLTLNYTPMFFFFFFFGEFPRVSLINSIKTDEDLSELWYNCFEGADNLAHINKFSIEPINDPAALADLLNPRGNLYRSWLVKRSAEQDIIGFAFHHFENNSISFYIGLDYIKQGYGTEVVKLLVNQFKDQGIKEATAYCAADNYAAIRVLDKCEFKKIDTVSEEIGDGSMLCFNLLIAQ